MLQRLETKEIYTKFTLVRRDLIFFGIWSNKPGMESLWSGRPNPIITFTSVYAEGRKWQFTPSNRDALLLLKHSLPTKVSFIRAFQGWRASGAREERELGQGRAFLRWLHKHRISILWKEQDFQPHPLFIHPDSPKHDPHDELAQGLSFAIRPVRVASRNIKLYVKDDDMLALLAAPFGHEVDFIQLVKDYVACRFDWEAWRAPAPHFLDWVLVNGKRPVFEPGQVGFAAINCIGQFSSLAS